MCESACMSFFTCPVRGASLFSARCREGASSLQAQPQEPAREAWPGRGSLPVPGASSHAWPAADT